MNKVLIAFTSGIILGLLFAPAKGTDTRKKIAGIGDGCKQKWNDIIDKAADKIDGVKNKVEDLHFEDGSNRGF